MVKMKSILKWSFIGFILLFIYFPKSLHRSGCQINYDAIINPNGNILVTSGENYAIF